MEITRALAPASEAEGQLRHLFRVLARQWRFFSHRLLPFSYNP